MAKPIRPEPKFFLSPALFAKGKSDYIQRHFDGGTECSIRGEKSTSYLECPNAMVRIAEWYPDAKFVVLVRDPAARAISHYQFSVQHEMEQLPLEEALECEDARNDTYDRTKFSVSPFAYKQRGCYANYLKALYSYFPSQNIKIVVFEALIGNRWQAQSIYEFLGVAGDFIPEGLDVQVNKSAITVKVAESVKECLQEYFKPHNAVLRREFSVDTHYWA